MSPSSQSLSPRHPSKRQVKKWLNEGYARLMVAPIVYDYFTAPKDPVEELTRRVEWLEKQVAMLCGRRGRGHR